MTYLGIDCGTQGAKAILWDSHSGKIISSAYQTYDVISNRKGQSEQHPQYWLNAVTNTIKKITCDKKTELANIKAIGVSGQQHGLVLLDSDDNILCPAKLWCDTEPTELLNQFLSEFRQVHQRDIHDFIGINVPVAFTIAKLLWIKHHRQDVFSKIDKIFLPHEYINYWLTKNYCAEPGDASGTGYFDTRNRCWSKIVIDSIAPWLYEKLPPIIHSHAPAGLLCPETAETLDLPPGLPVSSGGGDNMMAAIGTGNISPGILTLSLGTSGTLFTHTENQLDSQFQTDINTFCSSSNAWLPLISTMNVTNAINAFRQILHVPLTEFESCLKKSTAGANGLYCFPWFNGARFPDRPYATGSLHGICTKNFNRENLLRCVVEGVTYKICRGIDEFKKQGLVFSEIRVTGGGAKSSIWCQIIADITALTVIRTEVTEAAALGAALQAEWCYKNSISGGVFVPLENIMPDVIKNHYANTDIFNPDPVQSSAYRLLYSQYISRMFQVLELV